MLPSLQQLNLILDPFYSRARNGRAAKNPNQLIFRRVVSSLLFRER